MKKSEKPRKAKAMTPRTMEGYAARRLEQMKKPKIGVSISEVRPMIMHDPEGDLHTLMRAAEIRSDGRRHKSAKAVAMEKIKQLKSLTGGE